MGLFLRFFACPHPLCRGADVADDRLPALGDVDVLNGHLLLAAASVALERLDLRRERPGELVEGGLGAVLLRDVLDMREASGEGHRGVVDGGHLGGEHRLDLVARANSPLPKPLLINLHQDSTFFDLDYLAEQVLKFTALSWRSTLPVGTPVTIYYSERIAELLARLRQVPDWSPTALSVKLRWSRWFL